jgi:ABC-type nitrate/sulfonate/bicarbonate transport system permease component
MRSSRLPILRLPDRVSNGLLSVLTIAALLALWEIASQARLINPYAFPAPSKVANSFWSVITIGFPRGVTALIHVEATISRILLGYAIATILAIPRALDRALSPIITFARSVATISLLPLAVAWFGVGEETRVFLITYGCFWVILTNVIEGVKQVDIDLIRAARVLGTSQRQMFYRVVLPAILPRIFGGMKVALGLAFLVIVAVEMVGTIEGLGALIQQARMLYRSDVAIVGMVFMSLFGFALAKGLDWLEKKLLPWAQGLEQVER